MPRGFKLAAVAASIGASMAVAAPAHAWTLMTYSGGQVWAAPWTAADNTVDNSPLRWNTADAASHVWYTIYFDGHSDDYKTNYTLPGLASSLTLSLDSITNGGKTWTFDYALANTSNHTGSNIVTASRVADFSFDIFPDESSAKIIVPAGSITSFGAIGRDVKMNASSTVGYQDICVKSGQTNNCNGGGSDGPAIGQTWSGGFSLTFDTAPTTLVLTDPMVRYQSLNFTGKNGSSGIGIPVAWVPEPATWAMMLVGFGALGAVLRSKRRAAQVPEAA